ncbi:lysophospholipid acyltransferase family protein [Acinetobacter sp. c1-l78]|uniref:lysophospholipid acyltransferase family protein n=1 Tax=Acinetobacter sp. c1-l78 TaxID=3342803 RepID=UPI0035B8AF93
MKILDKLTQLPNTLKRGGHLSSKSVQTAMTLGHGFYLIARHQMYKSPNDVKNTAHIQYFCKKMIKVLNMQVKVHGDIPSQPALWVSNHISWVDIVVLGVAARVFFLAKAEIAKWPLIGTLAKSAGTLFIQRGSGDTLKIRDQIADFLRQDVPVLFFPEATTGDGTKIKKVHGRLLGAAIDAQRPVQICLLAYVNQQGELDKIVPYIDESIIENLIEVLQMQQVTVHVLPLPAIDSTGHDVESLTQLVQQNMTVGLAELHQKVLKN